MSRALRRHAALLALVVWVAAGLGPTLVPHADGFDVACSDEAWASPHPVTQVESVHPRVADDHCVVCHLQRLGSGAVAERVRAFSTPEALLDGVIQPGQRPLAERELRLPARAPPVSLL